MSEIKESAENAEKISDKDRQEDNSTWEKDQKERGYYYDDSTGYKIYNPDEEEDDE